MNKSELLKLAAARIAVKNMKKTANPLWGILAAIGLATNLFDKGYNIYQQNQLYNSPVSRLERLMGVGSILGNMQRSGVADTIGAEGLNTLGQSAITQQTGRPSSFTGFNPARETTEAVTG